MSKRGFGLLVIMLTASCQGPGDTQRQVRALGAADDVVISQVYSGGGNSGATYTNDYVELLNRTSQAVAIGGWSVQYGSATGNFSQKVDIPAGTSIAAGQYFLVQLSGGATGASLPTPDLTGSINMGASAGKVALVKSTTLLTCGATANRCSSSTISDLVGYGSTASDYEGTAAAPAPGSNANAVLRGTAGCTDAGQSSTDFTSAAAAPRNSASATTTCSSGDGGAPAGQPVVISQLYGSGGNSGATYTNDYVELFNRSTQAVSIAGWSVQYASATGNFSQKVDIPTGTSIAAGQYLLIQLSGGATGSGLPTPDLTASFNMSGSAGKVALVDNTTQLACGATGTPCGGSAFVDLVGYGSTASAYEGSAAAPAPGSSANALLRKNGGCTDTDDNAADFASAAAAPRNSASTTNSCSALVDAGVPDAAIPDAAVPDAGTAQPVVISQIYGSGGNSGATYTNDYVELFNRGTQAVSIAGWSVQYASATGNFSQKVDIPTGTSIAAGQYLLIQLSGGATGSGLPTPDLTASFNMSASAGKVALVDNTTQLACGATGTPCGGSAFVDLVGYGSTASAYEGSAAAPAPGSSANAVLRKNGGCTDTDDNAADFASAAATPRNSASTTNACSALVDAGTPDAAIPDVAVPDAGTAQPVVISQIYGSGGNSGATYTNDYIELFNRGTQAVSIAGWSVQYGSAANNFSQKVDIPTGTSIAAGEYLLIQLSGGATGTGLPTPDLTASFNMSASAGKVALVDNTTLLACGASGSPCSSSAIVDLVGYGSSASAYEGSAAAPAPGSSANAALRKNGGCTDTDDNAADFISAAATPRNSASAVNDCSALVDAGVTPDAAIPDAQVIDASPTLDTTTVADAPVIDAPVSDAPPTPDTTLVVDAPVIDAPVIDASPTPDTTPVVDTAVDASAPAGELVVISQIYSAGGNSGATYTNDYVELFNRGTLAAPVGGWSVQYGSAAGDITKKVDLLAGVTLPPGGYYLVQLSGGTTGTALPTPDLAATINMSGSAGKVALVKNTTQLACGSAASPCSSPDIADLVGYGSSASYSEGSPASASSSAAKALFRDKGGCTDTDDNSADFAALPADPRNSASPINNCSLLPDSGPPSDLAQQGDQAPGSDLASSDTSAPSQDLAGSDAGPDSSTTIPPTGDEEGCNCSTSSARSSSGLDGLLGPGLAVLLLALFRRRRARLT